MTTLPRTDVRDLSAVISDYPDHSEEPTPLAWSFPPAPEPEEQAA